MSPAAAPDRVIPVIVSESVILQILPVEKSKVTDPLDDVTVTGVKPILAVTRLEVSEIIVFESNACTSLPISSPKAERIADLLLTPEKLGLPVYTGFPE